MAWSGLVVAKIINFPRLRCLHGSQERLHDIVYMNTGKHQSRLIDTLSRAGTDGIQRAAPRPVNTRQPENMCAQPEPMLLCLNTPYAARLRSAQDRSLIHPLPLPVAINSGSGKVAYPWLILQLCRMMPECSVHPLCPRRNGDEDMRSCAQRF